MNNIKKLISFLNTFCNNQHSNEQNKCCEGGCPNFHECKKDIWQNAEKELINLKVLTKDEDIFKV